MLSLVSIWYSPLGVPGIISCVIFSFNNLEFSLGGDSTGLQGSIVQKYDYYGTRLEAGTYRVVLEMKAKDGTPHYLAAEFDVE